MYVFEDIHGIVLPCIFFAMCLKEWAILYTHIAKYCYFNSCLNGNIDTQNI